MRPDALARIRAAAARKDVERGRPLTMREKLDNLKRWLAETPSSQDTD